MNELKSFSIRPSVISRRQFLKKKLLAIAVLSLSCGSGVVTESGDGGKIVLRWRTRDGQSYEKSYSR